ncbi:hypothetical protein BJ742DRAFT_201632 [Cladochytrium replicatum]|nr:hypothetical protein BJ742DRAFT_201632 [Cladochytrium replicatum]
MLYLPSGNYLSQLENPKAVRIGVSAFFKQFGFNCALPSSLVGIVVINFFDTVKCIGLGKGKTHPRFKYFDLCHQHALRFFILIKWLLLFLLGCLRNFRHRFCDNLQWRELVNAIAM